MWLSCWTQEEENEQQQQQQMAAAATTWSAKDALVDSEDQLSHGHLWGGAEKPSSVEDLPNLYTTTNLC